MEPFFDLVYVFAIVQISHLLLRDLSWLGFMRTIVVFAAVWWGWNDTAWMMNGLDPTRGAVCRLPLPGLGRAPVEHWDTDPEHLAERNRSVFIIALGESTLLMGTSLATIGDLSFGLLAGFLVAVSIEPRLTHPHLSTAMVFVNVGGTLLYLLGNLLFVRSRFGGVARSRYVAIASVVLIGFMATLLHGHLPTIGLSLAVLAVTSGLALRTVLTREPRSGSTEGTPTS